MTARSSRTTPRFRGAPVDVVIDVRSKLEFWLGHLPGARCIPVDQLPGSLQTDASVTPASRIVVYCASGARSATAAATLRAAGYRSVVDAGGIGAARGDFTP